VARRTPRADAGAGWFAPARPRVLAHRGLALDVPENTLLAFAKALAAGADYLETDVHVSADGVAVVSHDPDLSRVAGRDVRVDQLTMRELRDVQLGQGQGFCSLAELLDGFPEARLNIDIKTAGVARPAAEAILAAGATDRVLIASFGGRRRREAVAMLPGVATSASSGGSLFAILGGRLGWAGLARLGLRDVDAVQLPTHYGPFSTSTRRLIATLQRAGVEVHYWTVNDPDEMRLLLDRGADGIISDRADLALGVVASRG
jgi:glycerophosphoryl diester phosphodiesterase